MPQSFYEQRSSGTSTTNPYVPCRSCQNGIVYVDGRNEWPPIHNESHTGWRGGPYAGPSKACFTVGAEPLW